MVGNKSNIRDYFQRKGPENVQQEGTSDFSFIPSSEKNFVYLLGLEEVVRFRLEKLDRVVYAVPQKHRSKGRTPLFSSPTDAPAASPQHPFTCSQCSSDISCSWQLGANGSIQCRSCFKQYRRTERRLTTGTKPVQELLPLLQATSSQSHGCDQQVPKISLRCPDETTPLGSPYYRPSAGFTRFYPPIALGKPYFSSLPSLYSDSSSSSGSCCSSDSFSPFTYLPSSSRASSPSDGSSSPRSFSSDLSACSSSLSSSPSHLLGGRPSQMGSAPSWMMALLGEALLKVGDVQEDLKERENETSTKVISSADSAMTFLSATANTSKLKVSQTAGEGESSQPKEDLSKPGQDSSHRSSSDTFGEGVRSSCFSDPKNLKLDRTHKTQPDDPKTPAEPSKVRRRPSASNPRLSKGKPGPGIKKNEKFDAEVQQRAASSSSVPTLGTQSSKSVLSRRPVGTGQLDLVLKTVTPPPKKVFVRVAARNQKIHKWIQTSKPSKVSQSDRPPETPPSSSLDQPKTPSRKTKVTESCSGSGKKPCDRN